MARSVSAEYTQRYKRKIKTQRFKLVESFGKSCRRIHGDFADRLVRDAEPGITPNFVLLENPRYKKVWKSWRELLKRNHVVDELWRWQTRSWEEFGLLTVMIALYNVPTARLLSASPIKFREEQQRGTWLQTDNPVGVFHIAKHNTMVEVQYRLKEVGSFRSDFAAPIWIRFSHINSGGFDKFVPVWPLWDINGGLKTDDIISISRHVSQTRSKGMRSSIIIRPCTVRNDVEADIQDHLVNITIGAEGDALRDGIQWLSEALSEILTREAR